MRVVFTRPALFDLKTIGDHIARDDRAAAKRMVARVVEAAQLLAGQPGLGRRGRVEDTRELVVAGTPYIAPYRVRSDRVEVLRVFHGARKWPKRL